jgi:hypothetical protein
MYPMKRSLSKIPQWEGVDALKSAKRYEEEVTSARDFAKALFSCLECVRKLYSHKILSGLKRKHIEALCQAFTSKDPLDNSLEIDYSRKRGADNDFVKYL